MPQIIAERICGEKEKDMIKVVAKRCVRLRNVSDAARRLGVSHSHLSRVLKGERVAGKGLENRMARIGFKLVNNEVAV